MPARKGGARHSKPREQRSWGWEDDSAPTISPDDPDQVSGTKRAAHKKKSGKYEHAEVGEPGRYPRAPWDTLAFDEGERHGPHIYALYNYRLGRMEWSATDPRHAPDDVRGDYYPPGFIFTNNLLESA